MPVAYSIKKEEGYVHIFYSGRVTDTEFVDVYQKLYEDEEYLPGLDELGDQSDVTSLEISIEGVKKVAILVEKYIKPSGQRFKSAIVAPQDLSFGMGRMYEMTTDESIEQVKVFRNIEDAKEWLGIK